HVEQFELPMNKAIKTFSKGMQMKASLALSLSHHAELIIMDEPTAGLDPIFRRELLNLLHELMLDGNRTIFFSTHITTDLDRIADF
ncbi:sodium ABC transporter ATP-binding protein, partial [Bacillus cereus]